MKKVTQYWFLCSFLGLASGCTYQVHSAPFLGLSKMTPVQCSGTLKLSDATIRYTESVTSGFFDATYVLHLGQDLADYAQVFLPGMHMDQNGGEAVGTRVTLDIGSRTSASYGTTILSGNEVTVELKYTVRLGSEDSILSEGRVVGNGSKPTGAIGFIAIFPILDPVVFSATQSSFEEASQRAMSAALADLRRELLERGVCRLL